MYRVRARTHRRAHTCPPSRARLPVPATDYKLLEPKKLVVPVHGGTSSLAAAAAALLLFYFFPKT